MANFLKKVSGNLSLPQSRRVRGYEIRRMPIGAYIAALEKLQNFPHDAMKALFPGMDTDAIIGQLKTIDTAAIGQIAVRAFTVLPRYAADLIAELTGIPVDQLLNDPGIGLDGLAEIIGAWLGINNIENFINAARDLIAKAKTQAATGSKN